jgi:hypothetical protein
MKSPLQRLYRTKLTLLATIATAVGIALLVLAHWSDGQIGLTWIKNLPVADIGSALFTSGLIVIFFEYIDQEDEEARETERLRRVLADSAPEIRNAVVDGFAFAPESLTSVASPATIDRIIENCLALQLGERELASDAYTDLREQVLRSGSRWYDTRVSVALSPWAEGPPTGRGSMFVATVRWQYRVVPDSPLVRISCVSDPDEYRQLVRDPSSIDAWHFRSVPGLDGSSPKAFQLLQFTLDGEQLPIHRTVRPGSQTFTVNIGPEVVTAKRQVAITYTHRILIQRNGHLLHLDLSRPVKGLNVQFAYGDCGIRYVNVLDYIAGARQPYITQLPPTDPTPSVEVSYDGWVFPKGGVAFVWVLESELPAEKSHDKSATSQYRTNDLRLAD